MPKYNVDYIFPWVNPLDNEWVKEYKKLKVENPNFNLSYKDWGLLKYKLRSIAENMSWINNLYLILSSESQLPDWINTETVHIVYHKDYIPKIYLPTFNSCTIEMFLPELQTISDHFIYSNDDVYVMNPTSYQDFFDDNGKPKIYYELYKSSAYFYGILKNSTKLVRNLTGIENSEYFIKPQHYCVPWDFNVVKDFYTKNFDTIIKSITPIRNVDVNFSQYLYTIYQILSDKSIKSNSIGNLNDMIGSNKEYVHQDIISPKQKILCINDPGITDEKLISSIRNDFEKVFPNKCKYEK